MRICRCGQLERLSPNLERPWNFKLFKWAMLCSCVPSCCHRQSHCLLSNLVGWHVIPFPVPSLHSNAKGLDTHTYAMHNFVIATHPPTTTKLRGKMRAQKQFPESKLLLAPGKHELITVYLEKSNCDSWLLFVSYLFTTKLHQCWMLHCNDVITCGICGGFPGFEALSNTALHLSDE